jgi:carotenoid cleavage dioxygenase-like enzyme
VGLLPDCSTIGLHVMWFATRWPLMQIGLTPLIVEGSLPEWLEGDFYRTGPGAYKGVKHYFDGLAMLVNFRFERGGRVSWQQRFLDTAEFRSWRETGKLKFSAGASTCH